LVDVSFGRGCQDFDWHGLFVQESEVDQNSGTQWRRLL
jgi:hypothetical protein